MAGDWIKMRGGLFNSPKLIAMSRSLHSHPEFRDWLTPGGGGPMNGQLVSDHALRCVTGALLCVTWSWSREFGKELPNGDCILPHIGISDIDGIAGAPFLGAAMEEVGWVRESDDPAGVILPKFFVEFNVPLTPAEKQRAYRERKRTAKSVTKTLPHKGNKTVTREEKRREEINTPPTPSEPTKPKRAEVPESPLPPFPCVGANQKGWLLSATKLDEYRESFPGVDVLAECRKALQWCRDNPTKRKTHGGMASFLSRWLAKVQDTRKADRPTGPSPTQPSIPFDN